MKAKHHPTPGEVRLIKLSKKNIDLRFIEWFIGFVDAEGNFNISLRNYKDNNYNSLILTFQIGLHIDDLEVLKFIQRNLGCGKISISKNKCNFFVNDQASLIYIIMPIFNVVKLKSSKYDQFLVFEKAINLIKNKEHLTIEGLQKILCIKGSLNLGLSDELKTKFPNIKPIERPIVALPEIIEGN